MSMRTRQVSFMLKVTIRTSAFFCGETGGQTTVPGSLWRLRGSLQIHQGDESAPLWKSRSCKIILSSYKLWCFLGIISCSWACFLVCIKFIDLIIFSLVRDWRVASAEDYYSPPNYRGNSSCYPFMKCWKTIRSLVWDLKPLGGDEGKPFIHRRHLVAKHRNSNISVFKQTGNVRDQNILMFIAFFSP